MFESLSVNSNWQAHSLGDFLEIKGDSWIDIDDSVDYRILGVTGRGAGLVIKRIVSGAELKMRQYQVAKANQLMWCKVDTTGGAFGITKSNHVGALSSPNMCLADIDTEICLPDFLQLFFRSPVVYEGITAASLGTTNRQYLKPQELLKKVRLHLPSLDEQRRILYRVEALATRISKAQALREDADRETEIIPLAIRNISFDGHKEFKRKKLDNLCTVVRGSSPRPKGDMRFYGGNVPRLLIADISRDGKYVTPKIDSLTEEGAKLSRPMPKGSLVIAISGSYGVPAFLAVDACIHDGFIGFRDIDSSIDPEYLYQVLLLSKPYFDSVVKDSGLKNLTTSHLKNLDIPVPPLDEQRRIVAYLDSVQARLASLRELQSATGEELSALLPSVLDRAFKGEL